MGGGEWWWERTRREQKKTPQNQTRRKIRRLQVSPQLPHSQGQTGSVSGPELRLEVAEGHTETPGG